MNMSEKDIQTAKKFLKKKDIKLEEIVGFSFMKRYHQPHKGDVHHKDKFGPRIITLLFKQGYKKAFYLSPFTSASAVVKFLLSQNIPFENYQSPEVTVTTIEPKTYRRFSLLLPYYIVNILIVWWIACKLATYGIWWTIVPGLVALLISIFLFYSILRRFCYLKTDENGISIQRLVQSKTFRYDQLRKVNFDFAREQIFTLIMEVLDEDYNYHLYYIGRVPRMKLNEITKTLQSKGVDATCSLDKWKRYYGDRYDNP